MPLYTPESLETLRRRVDLVDVISSQIDVKRAGAAYKALCPFHDEKTPSFVMQKGDAHYHCFGCGAHGDAIQFLVDYSKMSFQEAVETLAQRFGVILEVVERDREQKGPGKTQLKAALLEASRFFRFMLLHTSEGHDALKYLYGRGISLDFVQRFGLGLAPRQSGILSDALRSKGFSWEVLLSAGLLRQRDEGGVREFFYDRITFPICDATGAVIGFSARKYREETTGGKYVNSVETPLFKKSRVLYGLSECRRRIAKEQHAIIVEGQLDALALIFCGLNLAVAALGTAFGEGHVAELVNLGVRRVSLAFDADAAGVEAAKKVGDLFQRQGIEVSVVSLPEGSDPDTYVKSHGIDSFVSLLDSAQDYLTFLVDTVRRHADLSSPATKTQMLKALSQQIHQWDNPVMVHESLRKLAHLLQVPLEMVTSSVVSGNQYLVRKSATADVLEINPDRILEGDLLRWLLIAGDKSLDHFLLVRKNLNPDDLRDPICRSLLLAIEAAVSDGLQNWTMMDLVSRTQDERVQELFDSIASKRIQRDRPEELLRETIQKILERNWMQRCEELDLRLRSGQLSEEESFVLIQEYGRLRKNVPQVIS